MLTFLPLRTAHAIRLRSCCPFLLTRGTSATDKTESLNDKLEPQQHICDCCVMHIPRSRLCDQLQSNHQTSLLVFELRQCAFCKEPLLFRFSSRRRNLGIMRSEQKVRPESESWETCVGAIVSVSSKFSVNRSNHSRRSRNRWSALPLSSFNLHWFFCFCRLIDCRRTAAMRMIDCEIFLSGCSRSQITEDETPEAAQHSQD